MVGENCGLCKFPMLNMTLSNFIPYEHTLGNQQEDS